MRIDKMFDNFKFSTSRITPLGAAGEIFFAIILMSVFHLLPIFSLIIDVMPKSIAIFIVIMVPLSWAAVSYFCGFILSRAMQIYLVLLTLFCFYNAVWFRINALITMPMSYAVRNIMYYIVNINYDVNPRGEYIICSIAYITMLCIFYYFGRYNRNKYGEKSSKPQ